MSVSDNVYRIKFTRRVAVALTPYGGHPALEVTLSKSPTKIISRNINE